MIRKSIDTNRIQLSIIQTSILGLQWPLSYAVMYLTIRCLCDRRAMLETQYIPDQEDFASEYHGLSSSRVGIYKRSGKQIRKITCLCELRTPVFLGLIPIDLRKGC